MLYKRQLVFIIEADTLDETDEEFLRVFAEAGKQQLRKAKPKHEKDITIHRFDLEGAYGYVERQADGTEVPLWRMNFLVDLDAPDAAIADAHLHDLITKPNKRAQRFNVVDTEVLTRHDALDPDSLR